MLRYLRRLQDKDLALDRSMIPLGSCTMKLNATTEMMPITWPEFSAIHPFAPLEQAEGYRQLLAELSAWLAEITGFEAISLQPNAGSQGEYAGLLTIKKYHAARGEAHRRHLPDPRFGARHQPGLRAHGRPRGRCGRLRCQRQCRSRRPPGQGERACRRSGSADDHLSLDPRRVRGSDPGHLRDRARARRPGLSGRRQPERPGRHLPARPSSAPMSAT